MREFVDKLQNTNSLLNPHDRDETLVTGTNVYKPMLRGYIKQMLTDVYDTQNDKGTKMDKAKLDEMVTSITQLATTDQLPLDHFADFAVASRSGLGSAGERFKVAVQLLQNLPADQRGMLASNLNISLDSALTLLAQAE